MITNLKDVCKPGGIILITTRSRGFIYHPFPYDLWRYETDDMKNIFSDCKILALESDFQFNGVFMKAKKPVMFNGKELKDYKLYSMVVNKKIKNINISVE